jgi:hypothetical protein
LKDEAVESLGAGGKFQSIPFTLKELSLGEARQQNVRGWFEGPFPWEHTFGFRLAGMIGHAFFKPYAVTFDFDGMRIILVRKSYSRNRRQATPTKDTMNSKTIGRVGGLYHGELEDLPTIGCGHSDWPCRRISTRSLCVERTSRASWASQSGATGERDEQRQLFR